MNQRDEETCAKKPTRGDRSPICAQARRIRFDFTDLGGQLQEAALRFIERLGDPCTQETLSYIELADIDELRDAALAFRTQKRIQRHSEWCSGTDWLSERERERLRKCTMFALPAAKPPAPARGGGAFILEEMEREARAGGLAYTPCVYWYDQPPNWTFSDANISWYLRLSPRSVQRFCVSASV